MFSKDKNFLPLRKSRYSYSSDLDVYQRNKVVIATQVVNNSWQYATFLSEQLNCK